MVEILDYYDQEGNRLGQTERSRLHAEGLYHKSVVILLSNTKGELFLQKRSQSKDVCPGYWDGGVAGHVDPDEDFPETAERELGEETDILASLKEVRGIHLQKNEYNDGRVKDYEFVVTYVGVSDQPPRIDTTEIEEWGFYTPENIQRMIAEGVSFTPWFLDEWNYLRSEGKL